MLLVLIAITTAEHLAAPLSSDLVSWEIALGAKYLSMALVFTLLLQESGARPLLFRSIVALLCVASWVDAAGHAAWQFTSIDSSVPILGIWTAWFIHTARRDYDHPGDSVKGSNIFIMLLRPTSVFAVCKALVGFPVASVCLYANNTIWSFSVKTGTFDLYPVDARWLSKHIAINTGVHCSDEITGMLDDLVGQRRWPGTKCVWVLRHVLARLGKIYKPRLFDYLPGIYAMRILKGRQ